MFRSSHDSIIKENMNKIMQITTFKAILARRINIRGCEDYKNTFAWIESDCTLRIGIKALIKSILYTKQSNLFCFWNTLAGPETLSRACSCSVWQWRWIVVYVLLHDYVNVRVCNLHNLHHTGHIENHKHTADLQLVALFPSHLVLVQFFGSQTQAGWWCVLLGSDP